MSEPLELELANGCVAVFTGRSVENATAKRNRARVLAGFVFNENRFAAPARGPHRPLNMSWFATAVFELRNEIVREPSGAERLLLDCIASDVEGLGFVRWAPQVPVDQRGLFVPYPLTAFTEALEFARANPSGVAGGGAAAGDFISLDPVRALLAVALFWAMGQDASSPPSKYGLLWFLAVGLCGGPRDLPPAGGRRVSGAADTAAAHAELQTRFKSLAMSLATSFSQRANAAEDVRLNVAALRAAVALGRRCGMRANRPINHRESIKSLCQVFGLDPVSRRARAQMATVLQLDEDKFFFPFIGRFVTDATLTAHTEKTRAAQRRPRDEEGGGGGEEEEEEDDDDECAEPDDECAEPDEDCAEPGARRRRTDDPVWTTRGDSGTVISDGARGRMLSLLRDSFVRMQSPGCGKGGKAPYVPAATPRERMDRARTRFDVWFDARLDEARRTHDAESGPFEAHRAGVMRDSLFSLWYFNADQRMIAEHTVADASQKLAEMRDIYRDLLEYLTPAMRHRFQREFDMRRFYLPGDGLDEEDEDKDADSDADEERKDADSDAGAEDAGAEDAGAEDAGAEGDDAEGDDAEGDDAEGDDAEGDDAEDDDAEGAYPDAVVHAQEATALRLGTDIAKAMLRMQRFVGWPPQQTDDLPPQQTAHVSSASAALAPQQWMQPPIFMTPFHPAGMFPAYPPMQAYPLLLPPPSVRRR